MKPPFDLGQIIELTITAINSHGEGIAKKDDFVVFVKGAHTGETCKVLIKEIKRTYAIGELI